MASYPSSSTARLRRPLPLHRHRRTPKTILEPHLPRHAQPPGPPASPANPAANIASLAPYTRLSKRRATTRTSILLSTPSSALTAPVRLPPPRRPPRRPRRPHRRPGRRPHHRPRQHPLQERHLLDCVRRLDPAQRRHPVRHGGLAVRAVLLFAAHATAAPADSGRGAVLPVRVARAGDGGGCRGAGDAGAGPACGGDGRAVWAWVGGRGGWGGEGWGQC